MIFGQHGNTVGELLFTYKKEKVCFTKLNNDCHIVFVISNRK